MFLKIHQEVGKNFVLCGSWPTQAVTEVINMMNHTMEGQTVLIGYEAIRLLANDVDVYVGNEGGTGVETHVLLHSLRSFEVSGIAHLPTRVT